MTRRGRSKNHNVILKAELNCPGCGLGTKISARKPKSVLGKTVISYVCENCESHLVARIENYQKKLNKKPGEFKVTMRIALESDLLKALQAEAREEFKIKHGLEVRPEPKLESKEEKVA